MRAAEARDAAAAARALHAALGALARASSAPHLLQVRRAVTSSSSLKVRIGV